MDTPSGAPSTTHRGRPNQSHWWRAALLWPWAFAALAWGVYLVTTFTQRAYLLEHHTWLAWYVQGAVSAWALLAVFLATWWLMLAAMMIPSCLPMLTTVARAARHQPDWWARRLAQPAFVGAFLVVWSLFGLLTFTADALVRWLTWRSDWAAERPWLIALFALLLAGAYQLLTLKEEALRACHADLRAAAAIGGVSATLRLGLRFGLLCLVADWALMLVMFGVGMTNLAWLAGLTALMVVEHLAPWGRDVAALSGVGLLVLTTILALSFAQAELVTGALGTGGQATQTQRAGEMTVTLRVSPAAYGVNTVDALVSYGQGAPLAGAQVSAQATMADMDMGAQAVSLAPVGEGSPGAYQGQADLTMPGRWEIAVRVRPPGGAEARAIFAITVAPPRIGGEHGLQFKWGALGSGSTAT